MTAAIELVTFDLYDTLIELKPPRWERLAVVCERQGIAADGDRLRAADLVAEEFYTEENTIRPIRDRTVEERTGFRFTYMQRFLEAAGLPHDEATTSEVQNGYRAEFEADADGGNYAVFSDAMPALVRLREAGIKRALISNADADVTALCTRLAFAHEFDLIVTSALVGWEKPDPRTFRAALDPLGVAPEAALHVGDQGRSDVVGALGVGMRAALLDRYQRHAPGAYGVPHVGGLAELVDLALAGRVAR